VGIFNRWWARLVFIFIGLPFKVDYRFNRDPQAQYIFCPNHFSFLDIPTMGLNHHNAIFVGKSSLANVPLFGYLYKKLHITVDRDKLKSRYSTIIKSREAIDAGKSLVIFIEGGIHSNQIPLLAPLKDGAFRIAIEKQIPIVPVSIPDNWIILPEDDFLLTWRPMHLIFHETIQTKGLQLKDINELKDQVKNVIELELLKTRAEEINQTIPTT
jgi:1-acyl-sn-glycerol-3-phosphate acyltransferase